MTLWSIECTLLAQLVMSHNMLQVIDIPCVTLEPHPGIPLACLFTTAAVDTNSLQKKKGKLAINGMVAESP